MKKGIRILTMFLVVSMLITAMTGCEVIINPGPSSNTTAEKVDNKNPDTEKTELSITSVEESFVLKSREELDTDIEEMYSFYDDKFDYYVFYLGVAQDVPLQDNVPIHKNSGNGGTVSLEETVSSTEAISEVLKTATQYCVDIDVKMSQSAEVSTIIPIKGLSASISRGLEANIHEYREFSSEHSIDKAASVTKTTKHGYQLDFSVVPNGFYRYILMAEVNYYGVLIKDSSSGKYYTHIYPVIAGEYFTVQYSKDDITFRKKVEDKFNFELSENEIEMLEKPEFSIVDIGGVITKVFPNSVGVKMIDATYTYLYDRYDLSSLSEYRNNQYIFEFNLTITMKEDDNGYQEIYLTDEAKGIITGNSEISLGKSDLQDSYIDHTEIFEVTGDKLPSVVCLMYGAHGDYADDWYRKAVHLELTVKKNDKRDTPPVINYDSGYNPKEIDATYQYTLDTLNLSEISSYLNSINKIKFTIEVKMKEEYNGYQEIYLVDASKKVVGRVYDFSVSGGDKQTSYVWETFVFEVDGSLCTETMYLEYGAHGDYADDWYRGHVRAKIEVIS